MKKNQKLGFTLIELLAVVVILAVIALISTPIILDLIENSQKGAFKNTAYGIIEAGKYNYTNEIIKSSDVKAMAFSYVDGVETSNPSGRKLDYKGDRPKTGAVLLNAEGQIAIAIYNGKFCASKSYTDTQATISEITEDECLLTINTDTSAASAPVLSTNMIPITWNNGKWVKASASNMPGATQWYDYSNQKWANVALVNQSSRTGYVASTVGTEVLEADVMAYLVWIPRYKYKLFNVGASTVTPNAIDVVFENKTTPKSVSIINGSYLTHPAFTFGTTELNGIWVGKFETTGTAAIPTIKPSITALVNQTAHDQFVSAQLFDTDTIYGLASTNDSHMMKNTEWGAVAYLSRSVFGKNSEVWLNSSSTYKTGCGAISASAAASSTCQLYDTGNGQQASTTGNVFGVYDMSGGSYERVMAAPYDAATNINIYMPTTSGFTTTSAITVAYLNDSANARYLDKYNYATTYTDYSRRILGDASSETRAWYADYGRLLYTASTTSWSLRGDTSANLTATGIFAHRYTNGAIGANVAFRVTLIAE